MADIVFTTNQISPFTSSSLSAGGYPSAGLIDDAQQMVSTMTVNRTFGTHILCKFGHWALSAFNAEQESGSEGGTTLQSFLGEQGSQADNGQSEVSLSEKTPNKFSELRSHWNASRKNNQETDCQSGRRLLSSNDIRPSGVGALKHLERSPKPWGFCVFAPVLDGAAHG